MKTKEQIEIPSRIVRRNLTTPTAKIPAGAGGRREIIAEEDPEAIRPFRVHVPEEEIAELKRRIKATRWPEQETVSDQSQGVPLETIQALARYWANDYDWRKIESRINSYPNFITEIDGLDFHFILDTPTSAMAMPAKIDLALGQLLGYEPFLNEGKLAYIQRNIETPCPPRSAVPVNSRAWFRECVSPQHARFAFGQGCDWPSYVADSLFGLWPVAY